MPLYEYYCAECRNTFDALRSMDKADMTIQCKHCESRSTSRVLSIFAPRSKGADNTVTPAMTRGGGCCGGSCGCGH